MYVRVLCGVLYGGGGVCGVVCVCVRVCVCVSVFSGRFLQRRPYRFNFKAFLFGHVVQ